MGSRQWILLIACLLLIKYGRLLWEYLRLLSDCCGQILHTWVLMIYHCVSMGLPGRVDLLLWDRLKVEGLHPGALLKDWHCALFERVVGDLGLLHGRDVAQVIQTDIWSYLNTDMLLLSRSTLAIRLPHALVNRQMSLSRTDNRQLLRCLLLEIRCVAPPIKRVIWAIVSVSSLRSARTVDVGVWHASHILLQDHLRLTCLPCSLRYHIRSYLPSLWALTTRLSLLCRSKHRLFRFTCIFGYRYWILC